MEEITNNLQGMKIAQQPTGIGARLKTARESLHLNEKDVAARLNLNPRFIHMMENESFEAGLPLTFTRGYLRSYARLLNLNENETNIAIGQLDHSFSATAATAVLPPITKRSGNQLDRYLRWMSYFIISFLFVLVIVWWVSHPRYNEPEMVTKKISPSASILEPNSTQETSMNLPALSAQPHTPATPTAPLSVQAQANPLVVTKTPAGTSASHITVADSKKASVVAPPAKVEQDDDSDSEEEIY